MARAGLGRVVLRGQGEEVGQPGGFGRARGWGIGCGAGARRRLGVGGRGWGEFSGFPVGEHGFQRVQGGGEVAFQAGDEGGEEEAQEGARGLGRADARGGAGQEGGWRLDHVSYLG
jgi:hypothetical protein